MSEKYSWFCLCLDENLTCFAPQPRLSDLECKQAGYWMEAVASFSLAVSSGCTGVWLVLSHAVAASWLVAADIGRLSSCAWLVGCQRGTSRSSRWFAACIRRLAGQCQSTGFLQARKEVEPVAARTQESRLLSGRGQSAWNRKNIIVCQNSLA